MKRKLLLLLIVQFFLVPSLMAQQDTIRHLIFTKWNGAQMQQAFAQITNVGDSSIDLSRFTLMNVASSTAASSVLDGIPVYSGNFARFTLRLSGRLDAGQSMLFMNVWDNIPASGLTHQLEKMLPLADVKVHCTELSTPYPVAIPELEVWGKDSIDAFDFLLRNWSGAHATVLYYRLSDTDSVMIDQVNLSFDPTTMKLIDKPSAVAGVTDASFYSYLVRKANIKRGNTNWDNARGASAEDSEWIAIPKWQGRTPYTTLKNFGDFNISLSSTVADINMNDKTITVAWGTERGDSILNVLEMGTGMGWQFTHNPVSADSAYNSVREGDTLHVFACGNELREMYFTLKVAPPANDAAFVLPLRNYSYETGYWGMGSRYYVTKNQPGIDTIGNVPFATRVDTLFAYLEKAPDATWEIVWVDGEERVDLKNGDKLKVTAQNGTTTKEYYIDVLDYEPSDNASLSAITWPDIPFFLEGWSEDTIPLFSSIKAAYTVIIPYGTTSVPALKATPANLRAKVETVRATSLSGSLAERTTTFNVTAEDDSTTMKYTVTFKLEQPDEVIQKYYGDPFITEVVTNYASWISSLEIYNPRNVTLDLSEYMIVRSTSLNPATGITNSIPAVPTDANFMNRYVSYVPGYKYSDDTITWKTSPGKLYIDPDIDPLLEPGETFVMTSASIGRFTYIDERPWLAERINKRWDSYAAAQIDAQGVNVRMTPPGLKRGAEAVFLFKILNDSILNGTKQVGDPNDFELIDAFGDAVADNIWNIAGRNVANNTNCRIRLKSNVIKGKTTLGDGVGTDAESSDWIVNVLGDPDLSNAHDLHLFIGLHDIDPITVYLSTISSLTYLVSDGYEGLQTIQGDLSSKTLEQFYANISKADTGQVLTLKSGTDGSVKALTDNVAGDDTLLVVSADGKNTTRYALINQPLDNNAVLTAKDGSGYTIDISGSTGSISGIGYGSTLAEVLDNVEKPAMATLNVIDADNNLVPLKMLNYDTVYVDTKVGDSYFFEVVAQDGVTVITYQLVPSALSNDAFVVSSLYEVNQDSLLISGIADGTSVQLFFNNIEVVRGATAELQDKKSFMRELGFMYYDDVLVVTSEDQTKTVTYYLDFLMEENPDRPKIIISDGRIRAENNELLIYPNPSNDRIYIKGASDNAMVRLTDISGRTITLKRAAELMDGMSLSGQPAGIYMVIVTDENHAARFAKVIKH